MLALLADPCPPRSVSTLPHPPGARRGLGATRVPSGMLVARHGAPGKCHHSESQGTAPVQRALRCAQACK